MNKRQAKKIIKQKWGIETYNFHCAPKKVDNMYAYILNKVKHKTIIEIEKVILFGTNMRAQE